MPRTAKADKTCPKCQETGLVYRDDPNGSSVLYSQEKHEYHGGKLRVCEKYLSKGISYQLEVNANGVVNGDFIGTQTQPEPKPETKPQTEPKTETKPEYSAGSLEAIVESIARKTAADVADEKLKEYEPTTTSRRTEIIEWSSGAKVEIEGQHETFPEILSTVSASIPTLIYGPAGSGKTTVCSAVAKALGIGYEEISICDATETHDLLGYNNVKGEWQDTPITKAAKNGSLILIDEIDAGNSNALLQLNALAANRSYWDSSLAETRKCHESFRIIASANTPLNGATAAYSGRNKLDGSFKDRFVCIPFDYDENLEEQIVRSIGWTTKIESWLAKVRLARKAITRLESTQIVSPRASIYGAKILSSSPTYSSKDLMDRLIYKGMNKERQRELDAMIKTIGAE